MEESGHYYTVYFTSLAVGFKKNVAYKHAVLAQMADEVGWLDAANLHEKYCFGSKEISLDNTKRLVPNDWRFVIETALHSLTGGDSEKQRFNTRRMLKNEKADTLEFGLLLHKLGDAYAHSIMGDEKHLYSVNVDSVCSILDIDQIGHLADGHEPDYPYLRQDLFFSYLEDLFKVLKNKSDEEKHSCNREIFKLVDSKSKSLSFSELANVFKISFENNVRAAREMGLISPTIIQFFILDIRRACKSVLGIEMEKYRPESEDPMSLDAFLSKHPEIHSMVTKSRLEAAIRNLNAGRHVDEIFTNSYFTNDNDTSLF